MIEVAILGAGFSGICISIQLKKFGINSFEVFEKSPALGGTWHDNTYPGAACDVPSHLYSFSFEIKDDWTRKYSGSKEINDYLNFCADKYEIRQNITFNTEIVSGVVPGSCMDVRPNELRYEAALLISLSILVLLGGGILSKTKLIALSIKMPVGIPSVFFTITPPLGEGVFLEIPASSIALEFTHKV